VGCFAVLLADLTRALDLSPGPLARGRAGGAISVITTLGYRRFLLGPVVVGGLAELLGPRVALGTIAAAGTMIFVLGLRLKLKAA
jgi:hypothetical protein